MLLKIWHLMHHNDSLYQPDPDERVGVDSSQQHIPALLSWKAGMYAMALLYKISRVGLAGIAKRGMSKCHRCALRRSDMPSGCSFRRSELAVTLKYAGLRTPPEEDTSQDLNPEHFIYVIKLCNSKDFDVDQTEVLAIDLGRKQTTCAYGPVQTYGHYYRSQMKQIDFEVEGGYCFIAVALLRYVQTSEGRNDFVFCNLVSLMADILKTQKVTCPFAELFYLPEAAYKGEMEVLIGHLGNVLQSAKRRMQAQLREWRPVAPSGIDAFQLSGYMSEEKQVTILVELSLEAVNNRHFESSFLVELLRKLEVRYPWAQNYIKQRIDHLIPGPRQPPPMNDGAQCYNGTAAQA